MYSFTFFYVYFTAPAMLRKCQKHIPVIGKFAILVWQGVVVFFLKLFIFMDSYRIYE